MSAFDPKQTFTDDWCHVTRHALRLYSFWRVQSSGPRKTIGSIPVSATWAVAMETINAVGSSAWFPPGQQHAKVGWGDAVVVRSSDLPKMRHDRFGRLTCRATHLASGRNAMPATAPNWLLNPRPTLDLVFSSSNLQFAASRSHETFPGLSVPRPQDGSRRQRQHQSCRLV